MKTIPALLSAALLSCAVGGVSAKLPAPTDEAKAHAAEAAAKSAWSNQGAAYKLCEVENRIAQTYRAQAASAASAASAPQSTPPCTDPGPFVSAAATGTPALEAAGAHSPAKTATAPPAAQQPDAKW